MQRESTRRMASLLTVLACLFVYLFTSIVTHKTRARGRWMEVEFKGAEGGNGRLDGHKLRPFIEPPDCYD